MAIKYCIDGFLDQTYPRSCFELIIAEKSDDGTLALLEEYAQKYPGWLILYDNPTGRTAEGFNIALRHVRGDIVNCYIGHAFPACDYLEQVVHTIGSHDVEMAGGKVIPLPAARTRAAQGIARALKCWFVIGPNAFTRKKQDRTSSTHWMAVKKELIDRVGEFSTLFPRCEDSDWYERMIALGAKATFNPEIRSYYLPRNTLMKQFTVQVLNGWCRARLFLATGRGMRFRHIFPLLLFVVWCTLWPLLVNPILLTTGTAVLYGSALAVVSWKASQERLGLIPFVMAATFLIHLGHVLGMLSGLIVFGMKAVIPSSRS